MKFTIEQRKEIYKIAYDIHLSDLNECKNLNMMSVNGMCSNIRNAILKYGFTNPVQISIDWPVDFPEFYALKPYDMCYDYYWWDPFDKTIRKQIYEKYLINL